MIELRASNFEIEPDHNCYLSLYTRDDRVSNSVKNSVVRAIRITRQNKNLNKINNVVSSYFNAVEEWDRKLVLSALLGDNGYDWFEFRKIDNQNIFFGIMINGNRELIFTEPPKYELIKCDTCKISVYTGLSWGEKSYELTGEHIEEEKIRNFSLKALFNSESYDYLLERCTDLGFIRISRKRHV